MSDAGPFGSIGSTLLRPASWAFATIVGMRNRRFNRGDGVRRVAVPVISIGNIAVGGTGKTPMVAWAVTRLRGTGRKPAIAMRGYRATSDQPSDEALEYASMAPDVPVIADPRRVDAINRFLAARPGAIDCVVLDDGFQHRGLARELDVVLVDATRDALDGALLPSGWLREPSTALCRAGAVVVTRTERVDEALARRIERLHGRPPIAWTRHAWRGLDVHRDGTVERVGVAWLAGRRGIGIFGVGNPGAVRAAYERCGAAIVDELPARDHARHDVATVAALASRARRHAVELVLTTRKDWVKLAPHWHASNPPIVVPDLALEFIVGEAEFATLVIEAAQLRR